MSRTARAVLLTGCLVLPPGAGACYAYGPLTTPEPQAGRRVALQLTDQGTTGLAVQVGPGVTEIRGRLVERSATAYHLAVTAVIKRNGEEEYWKGEPITVAAEYVARVSERRLARGSTVLTVAGIALAVLGGYGLAGGFGGGGDDNPPPIE